MGLGRLGGEALTHASDLDLVYLFSGTHEAESDGPRPLRATDYFNRLAPRVTAALSVPTASGPLYDVDTRLRPSGTDGMLAVSLESFARYQSEQAWTWEHMALTRARPVFGSAEGRAALQAVIDSTLGQAARPGAAGRRRGGDAGRDGRPTRRPGGGSTSSSARAGWSTSNSPSTRFSSGTISASIPISRTRSRSWSRPGLVVGRDRSGASPADPDAGHVPAGLARPRTSRPTRPSPWSPPPAALPTGTPCLRRTTRRGRGWRSCGSGVRPITWSRRAEMTLGENDNAERRRQGSGREAGEHRGQGDQPGRFQRPEAGRSISTPRTTRRAAPPRRRPSPRSPTSSRMPAPGSSACPRTMPRSM